MIESALIVVFVLKWAAILFCGAGCLCRALCFFIEPIDWENLLYSGVFGVATHVVYLV